MNLEQLRGFATIARVGHFTRAAEDPHLTQPSLSRQISTLEQDLGSQLFHRARGNITLTAAGEALLPLARRMLADEENVRTEMAELAGLRKGRVRLGAPPTLCVSLVAEVLDVFHRRFPGIELHLSEAGSKDLLDELAGGLLDLALVVTSEHSAAERSLASLPLLSEELVVIDSTAKPRLGAKEFLDLKALSRLPQIVFSQSYDLRASTMNAYRAQGLAPNVILEGAEMDAVLRFVEVGLGVAVVPATVLVDRPGLSATALKDPQLTRTIGLAHRRDVSLTRAAAAMQEIILSTARSLAERQPRITSLLSASELSP
ncbi:LysR family transcriptional regulator [Glutamicibacter sp. BW80]|uniref:LysR family transcriptional regulator n=1 Tax=unclassified Glutamicibacter TaxID=2627139 RepID=UPI000BB7511A|nr:LysR family transcriptional regulator [Glutamicibacter sp. BW80]PCC29397.1 LysR family transcriptional regulator [Glutamicibacter sp. BW80]